MTQEAQEHEFHPHKFEQDRQAKLEQIRATGIDPYGQRYPKTLTVKQVLDSYTPSEEGAPPKEGAKASTAGRITALGSSPGDRPLRRSRRVSFCTFATNFASPHGRPLRERQRPQR